MQECARGKISPAMTKIKSTVNCKTIEEIQNDQNKRYSVFECLQDGSNQKSEAFALYDLGI